MNNKSKFLILTVLIIFLLLPRPTSAQFGIPGVFDYFETALNGIEEAVAPVVGTIIKFFFVYVIGLISLYTSTHLLETVTANQSAWLSLDNNLVQTGWHLTAGLANMLLILILIIIAITFILKIETFQVKKSLIKLIVVALLINFSLILVRILVDIGQIAFNYISRGNTGLVTEVVINQLGVRGVEAANWWGGWLFALAGSFMLPFVGVFAQLGILGTLLYVILPKMVVWAFQIALFYILSGIFFLFTFLFAARVFIIQILAVLSPLAFVCLILPQTEKYWHEWLKHLVEWVFLGIIVIFFLILGLSVVDAIKPPGYTPALAGWEQLGDYAVYYFFLFVYLAIVAWVAKRATPTIANALIQQATAWGGKFWGGVGLPLVRGARGMTRRAIEEEFPGRLERIPVIGEIFGGPGAAAAELDKERRKAGKNLEMMSTPQIRQEIQRGPFTREDHLRRARALEILAERNAFSSQEAPFIEDAINFGVRPEIIYNKMPHLTPPPPGGAALEGIGPRVRGMDTREFRMNVMPAAFEAEPGVFTDANLEVFYSMDMAKTQELRRNGSRTQKQAISQLITNRFGSILTRINTLRAPGASAANITEADRIESMYLEVLGPNFL